jgi:thiol-disulfide isomerase/thioredoxin
MMNRKFIYEIGAVLLSLHLCYNFLHAETKPVGFAIPFPDLTLTQVLSKGEQAYLGILQKKSFSFKEIRGDLVLIEFTSTYCVSCRKQTPIFNELYASIENDPKMKGKVKMIGFAAGNNLKEVEDYKKDYKVPYPIISDSKFDAHVAVGSPRTPFTIWVRKDPEGRGIVVSTHLGVRDLKSLLDETKAVLQYDLALLKPKKRIIYEGDALKPPVAEEELMAKAKEGMESTGGKVLKIEKISLKDGDWIYLGRVDFGTSQKNLFSKLASRRAVCDICHDTFFIYTFDLRKVNRYYSPRSEIDNFNWTEKPKKLTRTIGRSILSPFTFDPGVDSVSGATITAVLIFDSLDKGKEIFARLKKEGYIK